MGDAPRNRVWGRSACLPTQPVSGAGQKPGSGADTESRRLRGRNWTEVEKPDNCLFKWQMSQTVNVETVKLDVLRRISLAR